VCELESLVRSCRSSLADGLWIVDGFQGPGWVLERNEAGESQELKAIPSCLLKKKKRREERRTEKVKVKVKVKGGSGSKRENPLQCQRRNRQFKDMGSFPIHL
jgi:hypothetical protein